MSYTNFEVGQTFPLPIRAKGDGALFQVDTNGAMFILQLSRADLIAVEAFRTGAMDFALYEEDGILFLLYRIDGIFKDGWGDAPLTFSTLTAEQLPTAALSDPALHLYLVDPRLHILLALRSLSLSDAFRAALERYVADRLAMPLDTETERQKIAAIYRRLTPAAMRQRAAVTQSAPLEIKNKPLH